MDERAATLTAEQLEAIERRDGELLLDAGAGSGKTSVLVERFVRAVLDDGVDVAAILAITFTDKAAAELRERVRERLRALGAVVKARATEGAFISTIHGFCARVLRAHALAAGIDPRFRVLDEVEAGRLADRAFEDALGEADSELIASYNPGPLRSATIATYHELRSRGQLHPALPPLAAAPDLAGARSVLRTAAAALAAELGAALQPSAKVQEALTRLEDVGQVLQTAIPWPGELDCLQLPNGNGAALRTPACSAYAEALSRFREGGEHHWAMGVHGPLDRLLRAFGERYGQRKRACSGLDFEDLELLARDLLAEGELQERYAARFTQIMVDEFQDTNGVQLALIESISRGNLFVVGDGRQSIYGFRHADVRLFERLASQLERRGRRATLQRNFRSRREILDVVNAAFGGPALEPGREEAAAGEQLVELLVVDKEDSDWRAAEARAVASRVRQLTDAGTAPRDIVMLTRAATDLRLYERALEERGIATYMIGGRGYWSSPQVMDLLAYLRALSNPRDEHAYYHLLASPLVGLSMDALVLVAAARREGNYDEPRELADGDAGRLRTFREWFAAERQTAAWTGIDELIERVLYLTGYDLEMLALPGGERRLANVRKLMRLGHEFGASEGPDLRRFLDTVALRAASGRADAREAEAPVEGEALDAVRLMTIHRAKGLEFEIVIVADLGREPRRGGELIRVGADGRRLGLRLARPGGGKTVPALDYATLGEEQRLAEEAEERRIFYVAMTRARERLILSGATPSEGPIGWLTEALEAGGVVPEMIHCSEAADQVIAQPPARSVPRRAEPPRQPPHRPRATALSYSSLSQYRRCGYRFYLERVLGLPATAGSGTQAGEGAPEPALGASGASGLAATERGVLVHLLLERLDFRRPLLPADAPEDVNNLVAAFIESPLRRRLAGAREVRREEGFCFLLEDALITGVLDVVATEAGGTTLVVDYKSDRLEAADPADVVAREYAIQRLIYALAALRAGAASVEVVHLFLERPAEPVSANYWRRDMVALEGELLALAGGASSGEFPVSDKPCLALCAGCPGENGLCSWPPEMTRRQTPSIPAPVPRDARADPEISAAVPSDARAGPGTPAGVPSDASAEPGTPAGVPSDALAEPDTSAPVPPDARADPETSAPGAAFTTDEPQGRLF